jgi:hypothetical protein
LPAQFVSFLLLFSSFRQLVVFLSPTQLIFLIFLSNRPIFVFSPSLEFTFVVSIVFSALIIYLWLPLVPVLSSIILLFDLQLTLISLVLESLLILFQEYFLAKESSYSSFPLIISQGPVFPEP